MDTKPMTALAVGHLPRQICALVMLAIAAHGEVASLPANALRLELDEPGAIRALGAGKRTFESKRAPAGLFVRDGMGSELAPVGIALGQDRVTALSRAGLRVSARLEIQPEDLLVAGFVEDTRKADDRSVDVVFRLPFSPAVWWGSISETVPPDATSAAVAKRRERDDHPEGAGVLECIEHGGLAQDFMPIACVTTPDEQAGVALVIPPDAPCRFRFALLREEGCLELQFLFGLSQVAPAELKGRAPFRFIIYPVDAHW